MIFFRYFGGDSKASLAIFENLVDPTESVPWEGKMPAGDDVEQGVRAAGFVPLPVRMGDLVAIHGQVDHLSLSNTSPKSRHTFQLHLVS